MADKLLEHTMLLHALAKGLQRVASREGANVLAREMRLEHPETLEELSHDLVKGCVLMFDAPQTEESVTAMLQCWSVGLLVGLGWQGTEAEVRRMQSQRDRSRPQTTRPTRRP